MTYELGRWLAFRYDVHRGPVAAGELPGDVDRLVEAASSCRHGQPFLIGPDGRVDARVNGFFGSAWLLSRAPLAWHKYAQSLACG